MNSASALVIIRPTEVVVSMTITSTMMTVDWIPLGDSALITTGVILATCRRLLKKTVSGLGSAAGSDSSAEAN